MKVLMLLAFSTIPISIMGFAAFLIYKQVAGWGWFLLCATLLCAGMSFTTGK